MYVFANPTALAIGILSPTHLMRVNTRRTLVRGPVFPSTAWFYECHGERWPKLLCPWPFWLKPDRACAPFGVHPRACAPVVAATELRDQQQQHCSTCTVQKVAGHRVWLAEPFDWPSGPSPTALSAPTRLRPTRDENIEASDSERAAK